MNSMTGYGRATGAVGERSFSVQVNSVNRRGLDLTVSLPHDWEQFESSIGDIVRRSVTRGKVHVAVEIAAAGALAGEWDEMAIAATLQRLRELAARTGTRFDPSPELLWQIVSAQHSTVSLPSTDAAGEALLQTVEAAMRGLLVMRAKEGEALLVDFLGRWEKLHGAMEAIAQRAPQITGLYREQLQQRLRQAGLALDVNDERVLKEVALFADRVDISEELTRLRSHLAQLTDHLRGKGEIGRKAEFILQEIGREIHTIGSKANDLAISQRVIEFKNELERIREQMANVE